MKQIIFIALFFLISCEENQSIETIKNPNVFSIGFGSCLTQERSMPIFNTIKAENYDLFLMLGDNVYGDSEREDLLELREAYDLQRQNFDSFNFDFPLPRSWRCRRLCFCKSIFLYKSKKCFLPSAPKNWFFT